MGFFDDLFKMPEQKKHELDDYYKWAYPYGEAQKQKIQEQLRILIPKEKDDFGMYNYLICRQKLAPSKYEGVYCIPQEDFLAAAKKLKKECYYRSYKQIHLYMALVEADLLIDAELNYPSIEQLQARANEIRTILDTK